MVNEIKKITKGNGIVKFAENNDDSVPADGTLNQEAGRISNGPWPINPVEEQPKVDFGPIVKFDEDGDHGGSVSIMALVCTTQEIKEGKAPSNSICNPVEYITNDTKPADVENDANDSSVVDFGEGKDQHPSVFRISLLDSEQSIQEDDDIGLDSICFDANLSYQIDGYNDDPSLANLVLEVHDADSVQVDQNLVSRQDIGAESDRFTTVTIAEAEDWDAHHEGKELNDVLNANPGSLGSVDGSNAVVDKSINDKQKLHVGNEELLKETEEQVIQNVEKDQRVSYHLPSIDETNFSIYDLVWGKVKNHPWWPGQIFDPSDASNLAMKYQKKDSFLIGYYGDKTFGWCDQSQLKPFYSYFSQFVKQCRSEARMKAIRDILVEVSRRVELGMACSCLREDEYTDIQCQKVKNVGIRGGNIKSIIDRPTISYYFQPGNLLEYIKTLARFPNGTVDRLDFMIAQFQLKAFYHSKGHPALPVFAVGQGLMESPADNSASIGKGSSEDILDNSPSDLQGRPLNEQEDGFKNEEKLKNIARPAESRTAGHLANGGKIISVTKVSENSILSSSAKKLIAVKLSPADRERCNNRMLESFGGMELKPLSPTVTGSFKNGESVLRAASQMTLRKCGPQAKHKRENATEFDVLSESPIKKQRPIEDDNSTDKMLSHIAVESSPVDQGRCDNRMLDSFADMELNPLSATATSSFKIGESVLRAASQLTLRKCGPQAEHKRDNVTEFDVPSESPIKHQRPIDDDNSTDEMLSRLCLAASDPVKECSSPSTLIKFFTGFRNFYVSRSSEGRVHVKNRKRGRPRKVFSQEATYDISCSDDEKHVVKCKRGKPIKHQRDNVTEFDAPSESPIKHLRPIDDDNSTDEMLSRLCLAASDPVKECSSPSTLIKFFTGFRNFYVSRSSEGKVHVKNRKRGRPRKVFSQLATCDISCSDDEKHIVKCKRGKPIKHQRDNVTEFDVPSESPIKHLRPIDDDNSTDEMLSRLCLAASDPVKECSSPSTLIKFFTGFRNFYVSRSSEGKVHVKNRKRGRPRKVFSQQATYDISCSDDEKHIVKCKRGKPRKVISRQASSDVGCSDDEKPARKHKRRMCASIDTSLKVDKPVEKRISARPRKSTEVASPNSYDRNLVQKRKINSYLSSHEYNPSDTKPSPNSSDKNLFQKQPVRRPNQINSHHFFHEYNPSEETKPVEKRKRGGPKKLNLEIVSSNISTPDHMKDSYCSDMDLQQKRRGKSHTQDQKKRRKSAKEQLIHVAMNTNTRRTFVAERSIISVEEKIVDESSPTALILRFSDANYLPSETHLIRIFSQYGPLKEAETDVTRKTNLAKVVFKKHIDASTAFRGAGKHSIFGPGLLSYQLKPWIPKSTHDATHMTTSQANRAVTSVAMEHDMESPLPITTVQANHDVDATITLVDTCNEEPRRSDLELSEHAQDKNDSTPATAQDNLDAEPISMLQDHRDIALTLQGNHDAKSIATPQDKRYLEQIITVRGNHDPEAVFRLARRHSVSVRYSAKMKLRVHRHHLMTNMIQHWEKMQDTDEDGEKKKKTDLARPLAMDYPV